MKRVVVQVLKFSQTLDELISKRKILQENYEEFEKRLVENPYIGDIIQGTGGLRKTRLQSSSKGKRGGYRVCYVDFPAKEKLFLILLYAKNVQEDLDSKEKKILKGLIQKLEAE
jgi:hypothetical protein